VNYSLISEKAINLDVDKKNGGREISTDLNGKVALMANKERGTILQISS
jgi:hypothetical protein